MAKTRRLAAIMFTDMVGYTAGAQADESATLALRDEQENIIRPVLAAHQGRMVKSTGDGCLVEFGSALKATECALSIQRRIRERNAKAGVKPIQLRIGIHLGDVEQRGTDIFGDAVNIAARIEPTAEPGGICISGAVHEQVRNKIPDKLEKLPSIDLKGLEVPIEIYRVVLPWTAREVQTTSRAPTGLAVLPFTSISPDPRDEYFADGLTEEVITVLSQMSGLRVIARTSVMPYKSTSKRVSQIGTELRVSSILEGSVRKAGNRLRVTAQLIDVGSEGHIWATTYDRELSDIFAVQAELATQVADALKVRLRPVETARIEAKLPVRPDSYLAYLKGLSILHGDDEWLTSLRGAQVQFELAISLDSNNAAAICGLADILRDLGTWFPSIAEANWDERSRSMVARAIELDPNLAEAHSSMGQLLWYDYNFAAAEKEFKVALSLNPGYSPVHNWYGQLLEDQGRAEEALAELTLAEASDPLSTLNVQVLAYLLIWLGRLDDALTKIERYRELEPSGANNHYLRAAYHLARSDVERSLEEAQEVQKMHTDSPNAVLDRAWYCALAGRKEESRAFLRKVESIEKSPSFVTDIAEIYAELGDLDDCFRQLEKGVDRHLLMISRFQIDPRLAHVRGDRRYKAILQKMNLA